MLHHDQITACLPHPAIGVKMLDAEHVLYDYNYAYPSMYEGCEILRECRGIIFHVPSGKPVCRPYHKFFNLGEAEESKWENLDLTKPHVVLEKLDGSMIRCWRMEGSDQIRFGTRAGETDVSRLAEQFCRSRQNYLEFIQAILAYKCTPVFELCSRANRVVLDYPEDRLVLTAIRSIDTGDYWPYSELQRVAGAFGVDLVKAWDLNLNDRDGFLSYVRGLEDMEGFVLRFEDGLMVKVKADEYLARHKTLDIMRSEKTIFETLFNGLIDDVKSRLKQTDLDRLQEFEVRVFHAVERVQEEIRQIMTEHGAKDRKSFASVVVKHRLAMVLFRVYGGADCYETLKQKLLRSDPDEIRILLDDASLTWANRF